LSKEGKIFEQSIEISCEEQGIFYFRVRDVNLPQWARGKIKVPKNKYDCLMFYKGFLFPVEMKSTKQKSLSFDEKIIKQHQIDNLIEANTYKGVIPGFLINFREPVQKTFFIHIDDFIEYKYIAENEIKNNKYRSKPNKKSIPISICEEIGIGVLGDKKRTKYRWYVNKTLEEAIKRYQIQKQGGCI
jgi:penicillin-binding protein-related factor A (putative recombinase)